MDSSLDFISGAAERRRKRLVVQQSPYWQTIPSIAIMSGGTFERSFWTETLNRLGLESPGREEAVAETLEITRQKKEAVAQRQMQKNKRGRKKK